MRTSGALAASGSVSAAQAMSTPRVDARLLGAGGRIQPLGSGLRELLGSKALRHLSDFRIVTL
jgi:hypothetical protein